MTRESAQHRVVSRDTARAKAAEVRGSARTGASRSWPYVAAVIGSGAVILALASAQLWTNGAPLQWWALAALTLVSGSAVLKIPSVPVNFSISDVFTLTSAVVFGPAAGTVTVAIDSLAISARLRRTGLPIQRVLFNAAAPPVAMWLSSAAFFRASGIPPLYQHPLGLEIVGPWLFAFAGLYFVLNTFSIALAVALHEGVSVVRIWRAHFQELWFTFIGGALGAAFVVFALQVETYGLVILSLPLLLAVILHFAYRNATGRVSDRLQHLEQVNRLHLSTIEALAHAVDAKDGVTHDHIRRVQRRAIELATRLGVDDPLQLRAIEAAALLHDVGKLAIPEHILNKPGKLTPAEYERMKSHASIGADILAQVEFPYPVVPIVRHHHENWDGSGYPAGLRGSDIPIGARILSVVDCYDALTSDRPYRRALSVREAFVIIDARRGSMYDPDVVDAFRELCASEAAADGDVTMMPNHSADVLANPSPLPERLETIADDDPIRLAMDLGASLSRHSRGQSVWQALADALSELPGVDTAAVFEIDEARQQLMPSHVSGRHAPCVERVSIPVGERMSGWVAATGQTMINADAALDLFDTGADSLRAGMASRSDSEDGRRRIVALYSCEANAFAPLHQHLVAQAITVCSRNPATHPAVPARTETNHPWPRLTVPTISGGTNRSSAA